MQTREESILVLGHYTDEIFKITYLRSLTRTHYESFKLSGTFENHKLSHLLNPNYLIQAELVKTKKNWILKNILHFQRISHPLTYGDFLRQSELVKIICKHLHEDQETNIMPWVIQTLSQNPSDLDIGQCEQELLKHLGF